METIFLLISLCSISLVAFLLHKENKKLKEDARFDSLVKNADEIMKDCLRSQVEEEHSKYNITHKTLCKCMVTNSNLHARIEKMIETYVPRRDKKTGRFISKK